jgi:hypothetical protein
LAGIADANGFGLVNAQAHEQLTDTDFDSMVDLEGGANLFSSIEDGIDVNMSWLDAFDGDRQNSSIRDFSYTKQEHSETRDMSGYAEQTLDFGGDFDVDLGISVVA